MIRLRNCLIVLSILALLTSAQAQNSGGPATIGLIDDYMTRLVGFGFSGAVLVARDGQVLLEKGYGAADRKRNIPATKETAFDIGSNTKDFTKLAIVQLLEKNKLNLNDSITRFFDRVPADKAAITVIQLMDHTAGFGMYSGRDNEKVTKEEFIRRVLSAPLVSEPGKKESYSNPGYGLLAAIIEKVSGQSYEQYLHQHVFKPAGMTTTGYLLPKWRDGQRTHSYANGEDRGSTFDIPHLADGVSWSLRGAGGTLSTLGDMYKFHVALEGELLLSKKSKAMVFPMDSPATLVGGNGVHYFVYIREPANRIAILIASTDAGVRATEIDQHILSLAKGKEASLPPQTVKIDPPLLAKLAGRHKLSSGAELNVSAKADHLFVSAVNQEAFDLLASKRGNPEQMTRMTAQVNAMLEASAKGDHTLIHKALGAAMPFEDFKSRQEVLWQRRKEQFGRFRSLTILGTVPAQGDYVTTARLDFERGVDYTQFTWGGGVLRGIRPSIPAPGAHFFPLSESEFVSFKPAASESIGLSFKPTETGLGFQVTAKLNSAGTPTRTATDKAATTLPDTPAGRIAAAYFKAFNSGDEKAMTEFFRHHLSKSSQASRPIEERLKIYQRMREDLGDLKADTISDDSEIGLTVTMATKDGGTVEFRFEMDEMEPNKLKGLRVELR